MRHIEIFLRDGVAPVVHEVKMNGPALKIHAGFTGHSALQLLHDRFTLKAVAPLTEKDYYVRGCTALLDAIGYGVEKMVNIQRLSLIHI